MITIKKLKKNSYGGIYDGEKFKILYNPVKMRVEISWLNRRIENSKISIDEAILKEYYKFIENEK